MNCLENTEVFQLALLESADEPVWSVDLDFRLLVFNGGFSRMLQQVSGLAAAPGAKPEEYLSAGLATCWRARYERALRDGPYQLDSKDPGGGNFEFQFDPIVQAGVIAGVSVAGRSRPVETVRDSDEVYRAVVESAPVGIIQVVPAGTVLAANPAAARTLGYDSPGELIASVTSTARQLWESPEDRVRVNRLLEQANVDAGVVCRWKCKDGTPIWVAINSRRVAGDGGRTRYYETFFRDISSIIASRERMLENQQVMSLAQVSAHFGVFTWNLQTATGYWSPELIELHGEDPAKIIPSMDAWMNTIHSEDRERVLQELMHQVTGPEVSVRIEYRLLDGLRWLAMISAVRCDPEGKPLRIVGVALDITEQRRMEEASRLDSEILGNIAAGMLLVRVCDGTIVHANEYALNMFGYSRDELTGQHIAMLNAPGERSPLEVAEETVRHLRLCGTWSGEVLKIRKDRSTFWCDAVVTSFQHESYGPVWISVQRDITARREAGAEKERMEEQLRQTQKMESVGQIAGGVAHEFNNLLGVINGYAELLAGSIHLPERLWSYADSIRRAGESASSLTRQLLAFSRKQEIQPRRLDANALIQDFEKLARQLVNENMAFVLDLDPELGSIHADPEQLRQVLMSLTINAKAAMPDGGRLEIRTTREAAGHAALAGLQEASVSGNYVKIALTDTGIGMDEEIRQRVFEPFYKKNQLHEAAGLGLSTVYGIMRQNRGWVDVRSSPGQGSTFSLYFPQAGELADGERPVAPIVLVPKRPPVILLVEDQFDLREVAKEILELYDYRVLDASDAEDALKIAGGYDGEIKMLLTDLNLPGMDGRELAKQLRQSRPHMKVLFTSGFAEKRTDPQYPELAGSAFIAKPYGLASLAAKVEQLLMEEC